MYRKITFIAAVAAISACFCSCSILNKSQSGAKKGDTSEIIIPNDREAIAPSNDKSTYTPAELNSGVVKGDWAIQTVFGHKAVGETAPYLKFEPRQSRLYGNDGCNIINGNYKFNNTDSTLVFSNLISTMRACGTPGITDYEINKALGDTRRYSWSSNDTQFFLYFYGANGELVMTLMHQNFQFLNGTWLVESIGDRVINSGNVRLCPDMKLVIDVDEGKIHGNTGCNILNGSMETDMEAANCISFQNIATTRMACPPDMDFEKDLIVALEEVTYAQPTTKNQVDLIDNAGNTIIRLVRTTD